MLIHYILTTNTAGSTIVRQTDLGSLPLSRDGRSRRNLEKEERSSQPLFTGTEIALQIKQRRFCVFWENGSAIKVKKSRAHSNHKA